MGRSSTDCETTDNDNHEINMNNVLKCVRKGDTVYYSKPENINMIKSFVKLNHLSTAPSSEETASSGDRILSGEALYKTFTFEQSSNDEETKKCIAFWKSVMEKHLAPIKCSIIESKVKKNITESLPSETPQQQATSCLDMLSNKTEEEKDTLEIEIEKVHEQYRKMCRDILAELKKKKLTEIELIGKSRCKYCESITPNTKELDPKLDKAKIRKEIKELDKWKSPGWKQRIGAQKDSSKSSHGTLDKNRTDLTSWAALAHKECREKYEFKNIIDEKKQNSVYSEWRTNKSKGVCECGFIETCDCNRNPAVEKIVTQSLGPTKPVLKRQSTLGKVNEDIEIPAVTPLIREKSRQCAIEHTTSSLELNKKRFSSQSPLTEKESSEELIPLLNSGPSKSILTRESVGQIIHKEIEIPAVTPAIREKSRKSTLVHTTSSIELLKERLSSKTAVAQRISSEDLVPTIHLRRSSVPAPKPSTTETKPKKQAKPRQRVTSILKKSSTPLQSITRRSLLLKIPCKCSMSNCDCPEIEPSKEYIPKLSCICDVANCDCPKLEATKIEKGQAHPIVPIRKVSLKRNSLEIIRERMDSQDRHKLGKFLTCASFTNEASNIVQEIIESFPETGNKEAVVVPIRKTSLKRNSLEIIRERKHSQQDMQKLGMLRASASFTHEVSSDSAQGRTRSISFMEMPLLHHSPSSIESSSKHNMQDNEKSLSTLRSHSPESLKIIFVRKQQNVQSGSSHITSRD